MIGKRKFFIACIGLIIIFILGNIEILCLNKISDAVIWGIVAVVSAYITGNAIAKINRK